MCTICATGGQYHRAEVITKNMHHSTYSLDRYVTIIKIYIEERAKSFWLIWNQQLDFIWCFAFLSQRCSWENWFQKSMFCSFALRLRSALFCYHQGESEKLQKEEKIDRIFSKLRKLGIEKFPKSEDLRLRRFCGHKSF